MKQCSAPPLQRGPLGVISIIFLLLTLLASFRSCANGQRQGLRHNPTIHSDGLPVFNVARYALIYSNATCGETGPEEFCRLSADLGRGGGSRLDACGICDAASKRHPIHNAIDGSGKAWQSPTLQQGTQYEHVTVTLDLRQVYQVAYVIVRSGSAPRPAGWVLERSLDGEEFLPWQYYAPSDADCWRMYGVTPTPGKPRYRSDTDVICTSYYSKLFPLENGEIHTHLINGRPGANGSSLELESFTKARYVRLRLLRMRTTTDAGAGGPRARMLLRRAAAAATDAARAKRLYYAIRDINIGARCLCNGLASRCIINNETWIGECQCEGNTCGSQCEYCCLLHNQLPWRANKPCEECQCHGHTDMCRYDSTAERDKLSVDVNGRYRGGGVCIGCKNNTTGINCESCNPGYFRPDDRSSPEHPCIVCDCDPHGSAGPCLQEAILETQVSGQCFCRQGYAGHKCDACAPGYRGFPDCVPCLCDSRGTLTPDNCDTACECKANVEGPTCGLCKLGYYALNKMNPDGCLPCYCSGVSELCEPMLPKKQTYKTLDGWLISDTSTTSTASPTVDIDTGWLVIGNHELPITSYILNSADIWWWWLAPPNVYCGSRLDAYGSYIEFTVIWVSMRGDSSGKPTEGPDVVLIGKNGLKIAYGKKIYTDTNATIKVLLTEDGWFHLNDEEFTTSTFTSHHDHKPVTHAEFLSTLSDVKNILLRAKFHADQIDVALEQATINIEPADEVYNSLVEKCICPSGYTGNNCEFCDFGYVRIDFNNNISHINDRHDYLTTESINSIEEYDYESTESETSYNHKILSTVVPYIDDFNEYTTDSSYIVNKIEEQVNYVQQSTNGRQYSFNEYVTNSTQLNEYQYVLTGEIDKLRNIRVERENINEGIHPIRHSRTKRRHDKPKIRAKRSIVSMSTVLAAGGICIKCDCNGHSRTCNPKTRGSCDCEHNTTGDKCERCMQGYFGNPLVHGGSCKPCACPLLDPRNNFSPSCQMDVKDDGVEGYVCTQCPVGYVGDHCEICDDGFFGDPTSLGSGECRPCACGGAGPCDPRTGRCLHCRGNTQGWRCEKCKPLHWGDPKAPAGCMACSCDSNGAVSEQCNLQTGVCECKEFYTGENCDQCEPGRGNVTAGCPECSCHTLGATSQQCDSVSGECHCKLGVEGFHCDACQHLHWGFSEEGCQSCGCNTTGSELTTCDIITGQCRCKPHVVGRTCNRCEPGYWGLYSGKGCSVCRCDPLGSLDGTCDQHTGRCLCKPGVGGDACDTCLPKHYGFTTDGCKECEPCDKPGHMCDPDTGRCVCPAFSHGEFCGRCVPNSWGFEPNKGCKACVCESAGSVKTQCHPFTGECTCREGYAGSKCNKCGVGFFGYPRCRRCNCNIRGVVNDSCNEGLCPCDKNGQCNCKINVIGRKCDQCKNGTFGLDEINPEGCTQCFCFGKTSHCTDSGLTWAQINLRGSRALQLKIDKRYRNKHLFTFIQHIVPRTSSPSPYSQNSYQIIDLSNKGFTENIGLTIVPETYGNITIGINNYLHFPLYWSMPNDFLGDRILSYGGFLNIFQETKAPYRLFPSKALHIYPLVIIQGHGISLAHNPSLLPVNGRFEIRLHETLWTVLHDQWLKRPRGTKVTRDVMMVVLQNVDNIYIRVSDAVQYSEAVLKHVSLDTAIHIEGRPPPLAHGVELCECPYQYNASSCQNPSIGYYRWKDRLRPDGTIVIDLIGKAKPCECNKRSKICDSETGHCLNCVGGTAGKHCEICAEGYYGNPDEDGCFPCPCPDTNNNFAVSCYRKPRPESGFVCQCRVGHTGPLCDRCAHGYYGVPGNPCKPCACNVYGRVSDECDEITGQCNCKPGIKSRDCSVCEISRHVLENNICTPCDNCTQWLFNDIDELKYVLEVSTKHLTNGGIPAPFGLLMNLEKNATFLKHKLNDQIAFKIEILNLPGESYENLEKSLNKLENKSRKLKKKTHKIHNESTLLKHRSRELYRDIEEKRILIYDVVRELENFGQGDGHINVQNAVNQGLEVLEEIRNVDFSAELEKAFDVVDSCSELLAGLSEFHTDLQDLYNRINDMDMIVKRTSNEITNVNQVIQQEKKTLERLKQILADIERLHENIRTLNGHSEEYLNNAKNSVENGDEQFIKLSDEQNVLSNSLDSWSMNINVTNDLINLVREAKKHALNLQKWAEYYKNQFNATKTSADVALQASNAYQNIVNSVASASVAGNNASLIVSKGNDFIFPKYDESIIIKAIYLLQKSEEIKKLAEGQRLRLKFLNDNQMFNLNAALESVKDTLWNAGREDNDISRILESFGAGPTEQARKALNIATRDSNSMKSIYSWAKQVSDDRAYKLLPALNDLNASEANKTVTLSRAAENLTEAQAIQKQLNEKLQSFNIMATTQKDVMLKWNGTLNDKLQSLREKVAEAHRLASEIRIPVMSKRQDCVRTYRIQQPAPTSFTSISFLFWTNSDIPDSPLFYMSGSTRHFIAIEMVNRMVRLVWNLGRETGVVIHPERIQKLTEHSGCYYSVEVERILNVGRLLVSKKFMTNGTTVRGIPNTFEFKSTHPHHTILRFGPVAEIRVGGIATSQKDSNLLQNQGLTVALNDLIVDEAPIPLWNYVKQSAGACKSISYWTYTPDEYQFNGAGYSAKEKKSFSSGTKQILSLTFKSFDENSLILAVVSKSNNSYLSISLREGKIVFCIQYIGESKLEIVTKERYNTGEWIKVEAARDFSSQYQEKGLLSVNGERYVDKPQIPVIRKQLPDFKVAKYFVGGLPPGFMNRMMYTPVGELNPHNSMLGCLADISIDRVRYDPMDAEHDGVDYSCSEKTLNRAGFFGNGYIKLDLKSVEKKLLSFSFVFQTEQENSIIALMLLKSELKENIDWLRIKNQRGKIIVEINIGKETFTLSTNKSYNDGHFHAIMLLRENKKLELRIDDMLEESTSKVNITPDIIYFGGIPDAENKELLITDEPFRGTIRDTIINDNLILFNSPLSFEHVSIGRNGPASNAPPLEIGMMAIPMGISSVSKEECSRSTNYSLIPGAIKFGDVKHSNVFIELKLANFWQKSFTLSLQFRTYYPNGILFISPGLREKQRHYILLQVKNKNVQLIIKSRKKVELLSLRQVSDGEWHRVVITTKDRRWKLTVDDKIDAGPTKVPKRINVANSIYIGGVSPKDSRLSGSFFNELEQLRGCVKELYINNVFRDLITNKYDNIKQCFPKVENSSFFSGDAFAVYANYLEISNTLEVSMKFRTPKLNGILLSALNSSPAISLEIFNGKMIVATWDTGVSRPVIATVNASSLLCDNRWHSVTAHFAHDQIFIEIDSKSESIEIKDDSYVDIYPGALYIGGVPESQNLLQNRENFQGCIQDVVIGGTNKDWTEMDELHNVLLSSCPVA